MDKSKRVKPSASPKDMAPFRAAAKKMASVISETAASEKWLKKVAGRLAEVGAGKQFRATVDVTFSPEQTSAFLKGGN